jgi:hypothetical protein
MVFPARLQLTAAILFGVAALASCARNVSQTIPEQYTVQSDHTFNVPYEKAWQETVKAISGQERIRSMDRKSGVILTEAAPVDDRAAALSEVSNPAKSYKNSYTVKLTEAGPAKTTIKIETHLTEKYPTLADRESKDQGLATYLRQELFRRICGDLYQNPAKCLALFPNHNSAVCLPALKPVPNPEDDVSAANIDPMWKLDINIKDLQQALARECYDPGPIDGRMGQKTRAALIRFQKDNKLEPTGKLDESTMIALEI